MDTSLTRILGLLKQKGIKDKDLIDGIGLNKSAISDWKSGRSKSYKRPIDKIADYLDVSTEYLLGRSDDPSPRPEDAVIVRGDYVGPLSPEEKAWLESVLDAYRKQKK